MKYGVTVGKFHPFHKGHEYMIRMGAAAVDHLTVVVSDKDEYHKPLTPVQRYKIIKNIFANDEKISVEFITDISDDSYLSVDENGTVLDETYQKFWANMFKILVPDCTHFISSDMYGATVANMMGVEWIPIDPKRENFKISGTHIRENPYVYFDYIHDDFKKYYSKVIAIVGPESTGKTTMCANLVSLIKNSACVPEYGRIISEVKNNELDDTDFETIYLIQKESINKARNESAIVITDTENFTTKLFYDEYVNYGTYNHPDYDIDFYILLAPTVEWVDDGTRILKDQEKRQVFFDKFEKYLKNNGKKYIVIDIDDYNQRTTQAYAAIRKLSWMGEV